MRQMDTPGRVQNAGAGPHIAIAFPLRSGVTNAQAGRYALVCFVNEHNRLGTYRVVTVR
jgi:hypothetical protein